MPNFLTAADECYDQASDCLSQYNKTQMQANNYL